MGQAGQSGLSQAPGVSKEDKSFVLDLWGVRYQVRDVSRWLSSIQTI